MTTEEKFNAAVNVIRSLPKNGSYQPSNQMLLSFYKYYKQATEGPCLGSRPPFWDVVGRAKYDAWKSLGHMPKEEAMKHYVDELHSIVETMSYTDKVANFLEAPTTELDSLSMTDLELVAGDVIERVRSQPNSPLASRETSPQRVRSSLGTSSATSSSVSPEDSEHSDEEYIDSVEVPDPKLSRQLQNGVIPSGEQISTMNGFVKEHKSRAKTRPQPQQSVHIPTSQSFTVDINDEIRATMNSLKAAVERLTNKVNSLEHMNIVPRKRSWLFDDLKPQLIIFLLTWPFVASFVMNRFYFNRNRS
ncbi:acyl-CoA-binding domain-containing protein 5 [Agrilus planipennis]|uniref:Acyl-CoA-binding domain-containing protein 5 n=1 Tax=Agrilus planipennis TaxID=224129 RepID=A0A7F5RBN9_AGRPL|nr:acyl-CoA-binding domain-containing protein 5 [Agrilus planipennis]